MKLEGDWKVKYNLPGGEGEPDELGTVHLADGVISGVDPFGGRWRGIYALHDKRITAFVLADQDPESEETFEPIYEGVSIPFIVECEGTLSDSLTRLHLTGKISGYDGDFLLVCDRVTKSEI